MQAAALIILDGFGLRKQKNGNAVKLAKTPNYYKLLKECPHTTLGASAESVGLPRGFIGGSEVGHLNIGAGRLVKQELVTINEAINNGKFFRNKAFLKAIKEVKRKKSRLHILGLVSDKGVHSDHRHLFALLKLAAKHQVKGVLIHFFCDGRDSPPKSAKKYLRRLNNEIRSQKTGKIATVTGRFYSMDRDKRWERTKKAYEAIVNAAGRKAGTAEEAIEKAYRKGETDEFIKPTVIGNYTGMRDDDCIINFDYRTDRERQLAHAFLDKKFRHFNTKKLKAMFVCMTEYYGGVGIVAFKQPKIKNSLGETISKIGARQLRIAESEKYAHVTFFFNGQSDKPFNGEDRVIVPSPKVRTYDTTPEMSAEEVTRKAIQLIRSRKYGLIIMNYANPDMVGHTGNLKAAIKAVEKTDECLGKVVAEAKKAGLIPIVTADHGNCEDMTGAHKTSHTTNPVPFIIASDKMYNLRNGVLGDIAPTILEIMGINKPREMTGKSLMQKN